MSSNGTYATIFEMEFEKNYKESLLKSIPVVAAMDVDIVEITETSLILKAPLTTNINYEGTAFGGSLNTLGILSCYLLVHHILKCEEIPFSSLVIQDSSIQYLKPVDGDFYSRSECCNTKAFLNSLRRRTMGRAQMQASLSTALSPSEVSAQVLFNGRFVVTK